MGAPSALSFDSGPVSIGVSSALFPPVAIPTGRVRAEAPKAALTGPA